MTSSSNIELDDKSSIQLNNIMIAARCHWASLLIAAGIPASSLDGKHGPCPLCGGADRFRFDDLEGTGSSFCSQCRPKRGLTLLALKLGLDPKRDAKQVFQFIESHLGSFPYSATPNTASKDSKKSALAIWNLCVPLNTHDSGLARMYLGFRGISLDVLKSTTDLSFHPDLFVGSENGPSKSCPALVARVSDIDGSFLGIQRIFLTQACKKAEIPQPKKALGKIVGGSVKLDTDLGFDLGIAEGVETALAAKQLFNIPTWSALSANGLTSVQIPSWVKRVVIFADKDRSFVGQRSAALLRDRLSSLGHRETIEIPTLKIPDDQKSVDFLDVLNLKRKGIQP